MNIAICGSDGAGKTEIANYISVKYKYNLIEDIFRTTVKNLGHQTFYEIPDKWKFYKTLIQKAEVSYYENKNNVIDRSILDLWVIWQRWCWGNFSPEKSTELFSKVEEIMKTYDKVIVLPNNPNPIYDGFRYINKHYLKQYYYLILGFIASYPKITKFYVIDEYLNLDNLKLTIISQFE